MSRSEPVEHPGWEGWYFEDGYLCTPNGDRFSALVVHACFFWKQMTEVRSLWQSGSMRKDDAPLVRTGTGPGQKIRWEIENVRAQARQEDRAGKRLAAALTIRMPGPGIEQ